MDKRSRTEQLVATLHARQELGADYERALVEGFVDQLDREIQDVVDARVADHARRGGLTRRAGWTGGFTFVTSLVFAIPLSAIAGAFGHLPGLIVAWSGIVLVNMTYAWRGSGRWHPFRRSR